MNEEIGDPECGGCAEVKYTGGLWTSHTCDRRNKPGVVMTNAEGVDQMETKTETPTPKFTPLATKVLVEREVETVTPGGIVIPDTAQDKKSVWARVIAVGPGRLLPDGGPRLDPVCAPGDRVVLEKWDGREFQIDGRDLLLVDESGVLGVVEAGS
jgi:chaperonin GroES